MTALAGSMLARRIQVMQESATLAMTRRAAELKRQGVDVIGLSAGEPDFETPDHIKQAGIQAIQDGKTRYTPAAGIPELREAVAARIETDLGLKYEPAQCVISAGAKQALFNLIMAIVDPGDEVIIPAPYWTSYPDMVKCAGGRPVILDTRAQEDFRIRVDHLERLISSKTKAILFSSPGNPSGSVLSQADLKAIVDLMEETDFLVISDEVYDKLIYNGKKHVSIAQLGETAFERTVVVTSVSKTYAMTGWRIGYAAGPSEIMNAAAKIQSQSTSNPNSIAQWAALAALNGDQSFIQTMVAEYQKRLGYVLERLSGIKGVVCPKPEGAFFAFPDVSALYGKAHGSKTITDSTTLCEALLDDAKIAVVPGSSFGAPNHIRISYATSMKELEEALNRLDRFVRALV